MGVSTEMGEVVDQAITLVDGGVVDQVEALELRLQRVQVFNRQRLMRLGVFQLQRFQ
jgi:hypothetical protein